MNRRSFFAVSAGTAAAFAGGGCRVEKVQQARRPIENLRLAGRTLEELREQYRYDLFDDYLPFLEKYVVDHNQGGFLCGVDRDGSRLSTDKGAATDGCGLWVYSYLYNTVSQDSGFLDIARKSLFFLRKNKPVGDDLWPERFTADGRVTGKPDQRGYSDLFAALGLQEYAMASGEK
jgi:mannose/cellobiose epimerase-like protein (N-acyl-D-glucosamine 2-epimerase family)